MPRFIQQRTTHKTIEYRRFFEDIKQRRSGFFFECDAQGVPTNLNQTHRECYEECLTGKVDVLACVSDPEFVPGKDTVITREVVDHGIEEFHHSWTEPAVIQCDGCKRHVTLHGFTNTCDCGADYNSSGQRLAPREQWGEETGEPLADILQIP